jgi:hypothetical protein
MPGHHLRRPGSERKHITAAPADTFVAARTLASVSSRVAVRALRASCRRHRTPTSRRTCTVRVPRGKRQEHISDAFPRRLICIVIEYSFFISLVATRGNYNSLEIRVEYHPIPNSEFRYASPTHVSFELLADHLPVQPRARDSSCKTVIYDIRLRVREGLADSHRRQPMGWWQPPLLPIERRRTRCSRRRLTFCYCLVSPLRDEVTDAHPPRSSRLVCCAMVGGSHARVL